MKKRILSLVTVVISLALIGSMAFSAFAADYEKEFDFLDKSTFSSSLVYSLNMKAAGNSKTMGYKGFVGSVGKESTAVFAFDAADGKLFDTLTFNYRGYSIGDSASNYIKFYVSAVGEADYAAGYTDANWTLVGTLINDGTAGTGINAADATNRDPELIRSIDISAQATGKSRVFIRIDFLRSANIDGVPATYFALRSLSGDYAAEQPAVTEAPATEAPSTDAPVATEAPAETDAPAVTDATVATEAPATEAPTSPETGDSSAAFAVAAVAVIAVAAVSAVLLRKRENA